MDNPQTMSAKPSRKWGRIAFAVWILIGICAIAFLPIRACLEQLGTWILSLGWKAPFAYIGAYVLCCIFLIPSILLSAGVGPFFGFKMGLILTVVAANLGATVAFLLGRTLLRNRVESWVRVEPRFDAIDAAVEQNGFKIVALLRMSPIFPFTIFNYLLALTRVPYWKYALGTFCGMLPLNAAIIYISCEAAKAAKDLSDAEMKEVNLMRFALRIAGIVMAIIALAVISRIAARAVKKKVEEVKSVDPSTVNLNNLY